MDRKVQWIGFVVGVLVVCAVWLRMPAGSEDWDLVTYQHTLAHMNAGQGYYAAMQAGLVETAGGAVSHVWNFRLPTAFVLWRYVGLSWPLVLGVVVLTGVLVGLASMPIAGFVCVVWLCMVLHPMGAEQWAFVEVWALPFMVGAMLAVDWERWGVAALLALGAACVREQAALMLIGGLLGAIVCRKAWWPWTAAILAAVGFYAWHTAQVQPFLVPDGHQPPTTGDGGAWAMVTMAGPYTFGLGLTFVCYILWKQRLRPAWFLAAPVLVAVPLSGLVTSRFHWGLLVLPLALALTPKLPSAPLVAPAEDVGGDVLDRERTPHVQAHRPV